MSYSEDNLKKAADKKEWLEKKINDLETELTNLQETLSVINNILKSSSFQSAQSIKSLNPDGMSRNTSIPQTSNNSYKKSCNVCQVEIEMRKIDNRWGAYVLNSENRHQCDNDE
jgi:hypothetical protein|tara:strand:- start:377 stop:718 length:342 start_codon:yes stop_codon:yes gene_type:complete